jgi:hypothetical protein
MTKFRRRLLGYSRAEVDRYAAEQEATLNRYVGQQAVHGRYVAEQAAAQRALQSEVEALRAAAPMFNVREEIGSLLTSFATAVSTTQEQAERDALGIRAAADAYAAERRAESDRLLDDAQGRANEMAEAIIRRARDEVSVISREQVAVERAVNEVAGAFAAWMTAYDRLRETIGPPEGAERGGGAQPERRWPSHGAWRPGGDEHLTASPDDTAGGDPTPD